MDKLVRFVGIVALVIPSGGTITVEEIAATMPAILEGCRNKVNVSETEIMKTLHNDFPNDRNVHCLIACIAKQTDIMTNDNEMNLSKVHEYVGLLEHDYPKLYDKVTLIIDACYTEVQRDTDECHAMQQLLKCCKNHANTVDLEQDLIKLQKK